MSILSKSKKLKYFSRKIKLNFSKLKKIPKLFLLSVGLVFALIFFSWSQKNIPGETPSKFSLSKSPIEDFIPAPIPINLGNPVPSISARNVFVMDRNSRIVLYQKSADQKIYPASTTKMLTALVVLDNFDLQKKILVTRSYPIGQNLGLKPGEILTVEQLTYAMLVESANDAAEVLAENFPGGREKFIEAMNIKAVQIHLANSYFTNPTGIDEDGHYSTASDLARLADMALKNPEFSRIVATENAVIATHVVTNVNQLLGKIQGVIGVKTGYTEGAGQSLVTLVDRDSHPVLISLLGSEDRFRDTEKIIDWIYVNFKWENTTP